MTLDEWFGQDRPPHHVPTEWERAIWDAAQAEALKDQERLVKDVFAAGFASHYHYYSHWDGIARCKDDLWEMFKPKNIHSPEAWEEVP